MGDVKTLGIDLGPHSIGWALIEEEKIEGPLTSEPLRLLDAGVRVFPEGVDRTPQGSEKSRSAKRREARGARKIHKRRNRRKERLKTILNDSGLLPDGESYEALMLTDPYRLRAEGLDSKLTLHEFGRALYHICQRRGFKSNRKTDNPKETGVVLEDINELREEIKKTGSRTLGEFLYHKHDKDRAMRIRGQYTHRDMYLNEFELLWETQKAYYPDVLTEELKTEIGERTIFFQRPLKIQKFLVGMCEYEEGKKRSPRGTWYAQRFRMLQDINNFEVIEETGEVRPLTAAERELLVLTLGQKKDMTFDAMKKKLGLTEEARFNLENGERKKLKGNAIEWELRQVFKKGSYDGLSTKNRDEIIHDVMFLESNDILERHASTRWGLDDKQIERLNKIRPDSGYLNLSEKAIKKLLPHMEEGAVYMDAVKKAGYERRDEREVLKTPQLDSKDIPALTNPLVRSALHQVRAVVNSITAVYGVPEKIRVEMVRDLKNGAKARKETSIRNARNRKLNEEAGESLKADLGMANPSRDDKIKYKLWEECGHECPYTGRPIPMGALFGGDFEVEHIIPYSRSLDNSYMNKTLCHTGENRIKLDKTPYEFYGQDSARYGEILKRIKRLPYPKRKRFELREVDDGFANRKLTDTAYIAREVRAYLERVAGKYKVQIATGLTTAHLRQHWGLHSILNTEEDKKNRDDHRHHAVDAVVVALTAPGVIKRLQRMTRGQRDVKLRGFPPPWEGFRDDVKKKIDAIVVSHKVRRKVAGALHEETNYGRLEAKGDKGETLFAIRKPLSELTRKEVERIGDDRIRGLVIERLKERGLDPEKDSEKLKEWKEALAEPIYLPNRNGPPVPVRRVRLHRPSTNMLDLGYRWVEPGSNHHIVIYEYTEGPKKGRWDGEVVSMFEAAQRVKNKRPIINRDVGSGRRFVMSLSINEMVRLKENDQWQYYRVQKMDSGRSIRIAMRLHTAATIEHDSEMLRKGPNVFKELCAEKVTVDPMGRVRRAND